MRCCDMGKSKSQEGRGPSRTLLAGGIIPPDPRNGGKGRLRPQVSNKTAKRCGVQFHGRA